jgi:hypothetical protein|tara:strand:+ start:186 stop:410 length:225 start_codon:yes stop_codon:yes gene_type:complete
MTTKHTRQFGTGKRIDARCTHYVYHPSNSDVSVCDKPSISKWVWESGEVSFYCEKHDKAAKQSETWEEDFEWKK